MRGTSIDNGIDSRQEGSRPESPLPLAGDSSPRLPSRTEENEMRRRKLSPKASRLITVAVVSILGALAAFWYFDRAEMVELEITLETSTIAPDSTTIALPESLDISE